MREIKFRAWKKRNDKYKMDYSPMVYDGECLGEFSMVKLNEALLNGGNAEYEEDTIFMQYTGLKDKNGKEIFEGDVLNVHYDEDNLDYDGKPSKFVNIVKWNEEELCWSVWEQCVTKDIVDRECPMFESDWYEESEKLCFYENPEVIGNIYENPELLNT